METTFGIAPAREQQDMLAYLNTCAQAMDCRIRKIGETEEVDEGLFALLVNSPYVVYVVYQESLNSRLQ